MDKFTVIDGGGEATDAQVEAQEAPKAPDPTTYKVTYTRNVGAAFPEVVTVDVTGFMYHFGTYLAICADINSPIMVPVLAVPHANVVDITS